LFSLLSLQYVDAKHPRETRRKSRNKHSKCVSSLRSVAVIMYEVSRILLEVYAEHFWKVCGAPCEKVLLSRFVEAVFLHSELYVRCGHKKLPHEGLECAAWYISSTFAIYTR